jgi:CHAT domain-containing protein/predicted negative regulator of RcsB-dependent stress response
MVLLLGLMEIAPFWVCAISDNALDRPNPPVQTVQQDAEALELGRAAERELSVGQLHSYRIEIAEGHYIHVVVDQRGIDVVVAFYGPDGKKLNEVDSPNGRHGPEPISWIAKTGGAYRLEVRSFENGAEVGKYEVKIETLRRADPQDNFRVRAEKNYLEGWVLETQATAESMRKALDKFWAALSDWHAVGDRRQEAETLTNIGFVYDSLSEKRKALEYFNRALLIKQEVGDRSGEATTLSNIGKVYDSLGEKQKALGYYNQSMTITRQVGDRRGEEVALNNIGKVYDDLGEKQKALDYYNQALTIMRQVDDRANEAVTLGNIGRVYNSLGEKQKAMDYYNQALPIHRQVGDRSGEAVTLSNTGNTYSDLGERQKALGYYNQALTIMREVGDRNGEATALSNIGAVYDSVGKKQKALSYYNQALTIMRQVGDSGHEAAILSHTSRVYGELGDMDKARADIEKAIAIVELLRTKVVRQELRSSYYASVQGIYTYYIDLLMHLHKRNSLGGFDSTALQASERGRARSLLELLVESHADIRQGVEANLLEQERSIQNQLNAKAELQTRLLSGKHTEEQAAAARKEVDDLTERYQEIETQIREKSSRYAALTQPQPLSLAEIQKLLTPDTLLLEYSLGAEQSYLWAITQESYKSFELPKAAEIETVARKFYQSLKSPSLSGKGRRTKTRALPVYTADSARQAEALARKLSAMLLSPVASMLGNKRLVIVPDGALQYVPFSALSNPTRTAKWEPLILRHEIVNLPSASALAIQRRELYDRKLAPEIAVVIADPVFSTYDNRLKLTQEALAAQEDGAALKQGKSESEEPLYRLAMARAMREAELRTTRGELPRLPGTRIEAEEIVSLAGADQSKLIVDFAANRATATSPVLAHYRYVHFATHGLLDSQSPELSALVLSLIDEQGVRQDGYLRAHEIFNLNLPAELVVLSACETGLGKEIRGEGLVGLTRGFMYAGARRVVVSLWSVNDRSTAELMKSFYRRMLKDGKRPAEALRDAQIEMLKQEKWRSPYYWAPFILEGEWR